MHPIAQTLANSLPPNTHNIETFISSIPSIHLQTWWRRVSWDTPCLTLPLPLPLNISMLSNVCVCVFRRPMPICDCWLESAPYTLLSLTSPHLTSATTISLSPSLFPCLVPSNRFRTLDHHRHQQLNNPILDQSQITKPNIHHRYISRKFSINIQHRENLVCFTLFDNPIVRYSWSVIYGSIVYIFLNISNRSISFKSAVMKFFLGKSSQNTLADRSRTYKDYYEFNKVYTTFLIYQHSH